jgi:dipeptidase E
MRLYLSSFKIGNRPDALLELLGEGRRAALITNAVDFLEGEARAKTTAEELKRLEGIGLEPEELDLREYFGKPEDLRKKMEEYDLLWARGGNCFVLRRAFKQSGADEVIPALLQQDKLVYGGYSAGIDMVGLGLRGAELVDDPEIVPEGYDKEVIWDGLGLLPYTFAPHYKSDHPESADIDKSIEYMIDHHIPFIALHDGDALVLDQSGLHIAN